MQVQTISEQLFFVSCRIQAVGEGRSWVGTGFAYEIETTLGRAIYLVTNRHVLDGAHDVTITMIARAADGGPQLGRTTSTTVSIESPPQWTGHPNPDVDLAIMPLAGVIADMTHRGAPPFYRAVTPALCQGVGANVELDAIEQVTFIGYPNGLFDTANYLPIARRGSTATPVDVDYRGLPAFLIDASVFGGSSGSPVFIADSGSYTTRDGSVMLGGTRIALLGVLAAVHTRTVHGEVQMAPTRLVANFDEGIDLGIVYKASAFDEIASMRMAADGAVRLPNDPAAAPTAPPQTEPPQIGETRP